ncbi:MAG: hypothetical protein RRY23_00060 [Alistipes sp.]
MKTKLRQDYENACNAYLKAFCDKHGYDYDPTDWVGGHVGEIVEVGDEYADMQTIITDIDLNAPEEEFSKCYDYNMRISALEIKEHIGFEGWIKGRKRRSDEELTKLEAGQKHIEELKAQFEKQIKSTQNQAVNSGTKL